jgi:dTDP-4-amino-4,6-dideoxygalactose transaminase
MIPRLKPFLNHDELTAVFTSIPDAVSSFEKEFAEKFCIKQAISFPYGRSAEWAFFKALGIENAEIILPAYTCSVVAHAILLSGNIPRFVDINLTDFNMDLDQVKEVINQNTRVIVATHLFGYPLDVFRLREIVKAAEEKFGHKIWVIQDCAHSFNATFSGQSVINQPDAALFGLNISKQITSIFGGMLATNDDEIASKLREWRDNNFHRAGFSKSISRWFYLLAVYPAFYEPFYGFVYWLQYQTTWLNYLTRAYHLDEKVGFPPGFTDMMLPLEARVGLKQLQKFSSVIQKRREHAGYYHEHVLPHKDWIMPPLVNGATYSHYVIRVPDRRKVMQLAARKGIQLGELIEYCIPESIHYRPYAERQVFPNSSLCSKTTINLPVYASLSSRDRERVVSVINSISE